ncbi:MAG: hypothetical protein R2720_06545 [Candidatus Nanopelagicales bacterium]
MSDPSTAPEGDGELEWVFARTPVVWGRCAGPVGPGWHDPRVLVREPAKWVTVLRATDPDRGAGTDPADPTSPGTVLFRVETAEGSHHGPSGRFGHLDYEAEVAAWVLAALF